MLRLQIIIVFLFLSGSAIAQNPNPSSSIDDYILNEMEAEHAPGMSTLIVKDGEIVWINGYGFADIENNVSVSDSTVFLLASISKVFTGTALMHLHQNGQLDLDEDINNYLPFDIEIPNYEADSITFRMLMTHTSSILDNDAPMETYYCNGDPTIEI
jgi:CubicO group peptidase (beta-lactamase class C family)